ncbi:hypothetical protein BT96DRAFT_923564 [Gymnopus androsaceus JB14]|uniref:Uncharacterized protein n=1 Tax=Gymnopus androsaceus JB14 TaxID=1447944 RepID=A0A6A4H8H8_9AGAR|nr:hypothetical protein BT96DRAFT_923564 [Gymnopus androsaceus JB14]
MQTKELQTGDFPILCAAVAKLVEKEKTYVVLGQEVDPESTWSKHEEPELQKNEHVKEILEVKFDEKGALSPEKNIKKKK